MVHLRVARQSEREEIPLHFEGVRLLAVCRRVGWIAALVLAAGGISLMVTAAGRWLELVGALGAAVGAILITALVRCRRFESIVGTRWFKTRCGPLSNDVPRSLITHAAAEPATGWRRLYARRQVVLTLSMGDEPVAVPSDDVEELISSLQASSSPPG